MNKAFLVGINNYKSSPLSGCVNDIVDMASFLTKKCGFLKSDIRLLVDERATKEAIVERLKWLVSGLKAGDRIIFHYSGHGAQLPTRNRYGEIDGLDEVICPYDFDWTDEHTIRDKDFVKIFSNIPNEVNFIWISDSCHSGDLTKDIKSKNKAILPPIDIDWRLQSAKENESIKSESFLKSANQIKAALISGCKDNQTSSDSVFKGKNNGALTYFLLQELNKSDGLKISLTELVKRINVSLNKAGFKQEPQLEGNANITNRAFLQPYKFGY